MSAGIKANADGSAAIQVGGSDAITITSGLAVSMNGGAVYPLTSGTAVASTSGTSIDFTSIPSTAKRITVMINGVSTNGTSLVQIQLGSGSVTTSGYVAGSQYSSIAFSSTTGLPFSFATAGDARYGAMVITNISGNVWVASNSIWTSGGAAACGGGVISLSGTLDRVRITTVNGTDTFDAGSINIMWE